MDKSRDIRRGGASRFLPAKRQINKQSGLDVGGSGDDVFFEKNKEDKLRSLSIVGRENPTNADPDMGCVGSDGEDELRPTTGKRFKLPKRFFDDCNTVDHASVPRKLRSDINSVLSGGSSGKFHYLFCSVCSDENRAMKKRNHESISPPLPDSKRPSHAINGVQLPKKNGVKKIKLNLQKGDAGGSPRHAIVGTITKDEEEVVETLHALAEMFPTNDKTHKTNLDSELSEAKSPALPEGESSVPSFQDSAVPKKKEDSKTICPSATSEAANPSPDSEGLGQATVEVKNLNELSQPYLPNCKQLHIELDNSVPQVNLPTSLLSESEPTNEKPSCNSVSFDVPSELSLETGSKQTKYEETPASERKPEIAMEPDAAVRSQHELQYTIKERKKSGSTLWPGSHGAEISGPSLQSSAATVPTTFSTTYPGPVENGVSTEKDSLPFRRNNSWKRCSAHVYISRLIKVLQIAERKDRLPMQPIQLTPNEGSKQGVLAAINNLNVVRNGLNEVISANSLVGSAAEKNQNEVKHAVLLHKRLLQGQQLASTASGLYSLQKQSFDFMSFSAGDGGMEANNYTSRAGNGLEPFTQFHVPYLQSLVQNHTAVPSSLSQNCYSSTPFPDHLSAAAAQQGQVQLPPLLGSPFCGLPHLGTTVSPRQQQQQRTWAAQLATQRKPGGVAAPHISNWPNGRQESPSMIQYAQAILPPSQSSLELLGPKYAPISQQPQQLVAITSSLPTARVRRQHHHLPSGYEGNGGGFYPDSAPSLQLLCNEHL